MTADQSTGCKQNFAAKVAKDKIQTEQKFKELSLSAE
jgi:hypothetical protein